MVLWEHSFSGTSPLQSSIPELIRQSVSGQMMDGESVLKLSAVSLVLTGRNDFDQVLFG